MEKKKENSKEDVSIDWFEDHESYDQDEEAEELIEEGLEDDLFEDNEEFNQRVGHFLANQRKDVSLEKILEISESNFEEVLPERKEEEKPEKQEFDYMAKPNEESERMYKPVSVDTDLSRPHLSSTEKVLEEQKQLYKHISAPGNMIGENRNEEMTVRPEDTIKSDYLTRKKFTTGNY